MNERLREERKRIRLTQEAIALLGGVSKRTVIDWEKGAFPPTSQYLAAIAVAGADVQYILTGIRSTTALAPDERLLLERYRGSAQAGKDAILGAALGQSAAARTVIHGEVGSSFGDVTGVNEVTINMGKKKTKT